MQNFPPVGAAAGAGAALLGAVLGDDVVMRGDDDDVTGDWRGDDVAYDWRGAELEAEVPYAGASEPWFFEPS